MKLEGLFEDRRFFYVSASILGFSFVIIGINLYLLWAGGTPVTVNNIANVISILTVSIFAIRVWLSNRNDENLNRFWGFLALGVVLWTIAEIIWLYMSLVYSEVPYPSSADLFWLLGYVPITIAFFERHDEFRIVQTHQQRMLNILVAALFILAAGVFVIWPTITAFDPTKIIESLLNIAYPLTDVTLSIVILRIFFSTQTGRFSITWRLLGFGFLAMTVSDLMFSYTSWIGIYYPDGHPNIISIVLDLFYYNAYLSMAVGVFAFGVILEMDREIKKSAGFTALTKSSILLFVDKANRIISFSDNFLSLINDHDKQKYGKLPLNQALGIDNSITEAIKANALEKGSVSNQALAVKCADGTQKEAWLTAIANCDENDQFMNLCIVLRTHLAENAGDKVQLTPEQEGLIDYYMTRAGTRVSEEKEVIQDYYIEQIKLLHSIVRQFNGATIADGLLNHLNELAKNKGWRVTYAGQEIKIPEEYDGLTLAEALSTLLKAGKRYAVEAASAGIVDEEMRRFDQNVKPDALRSIDKYGLRQLQASS